MINRRPPTLLETKSMGGIHAQGGTDYQIWDGLIRVPAWLRNPGFESMIFEGLEDMEARFFAPHTPRQHLLERYQSKSGPLKRSELVAVFRDFHRFEDEFPQVARVQVLVTPALPSELAWLARDAERLRRARPFYAPFDDVRAASDASYRGALISELSDDLGGFVDDNVEIALRAMPDRSHALAAFNAALMAAYPQLDVPQRKVEAGFEVLEGLARRSIGMSMSSRTLRETLEHVIGVALRSIGGPRLHVLSDRNASVDDAIEIDARDFSGNGGAYPEAAIWTSRLLAPLDHTARWLRANAQQRLTLSGSYRLSTAFALGWSFRSAIGFELGIETKSGTWATDDRPSTASVQPPWNIASAQRTHMEALVATVGVLRDPSRDVAVAKGLDPVGDVFVVQEPDGMGVPDFALGLREISVDRRPQGVADRPVRGGLLVDVGSDARVRRSLRRPRVLLGRAPIRIECLEHTLWCLLAPDAHEVGADPREIEMFGPRQHHRMPSVVRRDEERVRFRLDQELALLDRHLEDDGVLVRAPPDPKLSVRFEHGLAHGNRFLDARQVQAQCQLLDAVPVRLSIGPHGSAFL